MSRSKVRINEIRLRATGLTREQARRLGDGVAKQLARVSLTGTPLKEIPVLAVRVKANASSSVTGLANEVANKVRESLKQNQR